MHSIVDGPVDISCQEFLDVTASIFGSLEKLREKFGVETVLIITRGNVRQPRFSRVHASRKASCFLRNVVRTDAGQLAEKLEGYIVSGAADHGGIPQSTVKMKQKEQIKIARDYILNGLIDLLREKNMPEDQIPKSMNYKSYQTKIVEQCGVVLVGYPGDKGIVNPGELDALMLKELLTRLNDGRCYWKNADKISPMDKPRPKLKGSSGPTSPSPSSKGVSPLLCSTPISKCVSTTPGETEAWQTSQSDNETDNGPPLLLDDKEKIIAEDALHALRVMQYDSPPLYFPESPESPLPQTPDSESFATTMNVLHQAYLGAFASFFPVTEPLGGPNADFAVPPFPSDFCMLSSEFSDGNNILDSQHFTLDTPDLFLPSEDFLMDVSCEQAPFIQGQNQDPTLHPWIEAWSSSSPQFSV